MIKNQLSETILTALEISFYLNPVDDGLTPTQIINICTARDFKEGEIKDYTDDLLKSDQIYFSNKKYKLNKENYMHFIIFGSMISENDPRNLKCTQFIVDYLRNLTKQYGKKNAKINIVNFASIGSENHFTEKDFLVSLYSLKFAKIINLENNEIKLNEHTDYYFSSNANSHTRRPIRPLLDELKPIVERNIAKTEGNILESGNALEEFSEIIEKLNFGNFKAWWNSIRIEMATINHFTAPITALVFSAALCEGMLSFIAEYAKDKNRSFTKGLPIDHKEWKFKTLIESACSGNYPIINMDNKLREPLLLLNEQRQVIHAAGLLKKHANNSIPNISIDDADIAKATTFRLSKSIIKWYKESNQA